MVIFLETVWNKHPSLFAERGEVRLSDLLEVVLERKLSNPRPQTNARPLITHKCAAGTLYDWAIKAAC